MVIYMKWGPDKTQNYTPICSLPQLYKLFSTMIYTRYANLDQHQDPDQAGFRNKFQTAEHLMTYRLVAQKSKEWRTDMWVAAIDFQKTFDSIQHDAIWRYLRNHSISEQYICLLKKS